MGGKAVVLLSGGLDSSTLLYHLHSEEKYWCFPLSVFYGQRHSCELDAAAEVASSLRLQTVEVDAGEALLPIFHEASSSQVGREVDVPEGRYDSPSMKTTIVPNRNMLLLSIAGAYAESIGAEIIAYAAHAGDHPIYPDCRPEFYSLLNRALGVATEGRVRIFAPFGTASKSEIVKIGDRLQVPFHLTYSCYNGRPSHCGKCGTCVERKEAFQLAGVPDPTTYEGEEKK